MHKEENQVSSCVGLSESSIDVLTRPMPLLGKEEIWTVGKYLSSLLLWNSVLLRQLLNNVVDPDEA